MHIQSFLHHLCVYIQSFLHHLFKASHQFLEAYETKKLPLPLFLPPSVIPIKPNFDTRYFPLSRPPFLPIPLSRPPFLPILTIQKCGQLGSRRPSSEIHRPRFHQPTHPSVLWSVTRSHISYEICVTIWSEIGTRCQWKLRSVRWHAQEQVLIIESVRLRSGYWRPQPWWASWLNLKTCLGISWGVYFLFPIRSDRK